MPCTYFIFILSACLSDSGGPQKNISPRSGEIFFWHILAANLHEVRRRNMNRPAKPAGLKIGAFSGVRFLVFGGVFFVRVFVCFFPMICRLACFWPFFWVFGSLRFLDFGFRDVIFWFLDLLIFWFWFLSFGCLCGRHNFISVSVSKLFCCVLSYLFLFFYFWSVLVFLFCFYFWCRHNLFCVVIFILVTSLC